jgi:SAM-dependent methyltransferase
MPEGAVRHLRREAHRERDREDRERHRAGIRPHRLDNAAIGDDVFGARFARIYDLLYSDKDYERECGEIVRLVARFAQRPVRRILDLGAGTGGHARLLAGRGYAVTAVDRSADMIAIGRAKTATSPGEVTWRQEDVRTLDLDASYDAVLAMFAVLSYLTTNDEMLAALRSVRRHVVEGGLFLFDVWHGNAVLHVHPSTRAKYASRDGLRLVRISTPTLRPERNVCEVDQHAMLIGDDGRLREEIRESHAVRYFFPAELDLFLRQTGFESLLMYPFPEPDRPLGVSDWDLGVVARAV